MIKVDNLFKLLKKNDINFFSGVPDSILKEFSSALKNKSKKNHIIATNEGAAVSLGIGHYLSTNKIPCIYMQNSGLSNALNPLISIANKSVYSIPLILIIGWRGSPKMDDEPQHNVKGKITRNILKLLEGNFKGGNVLENQNIREGIKVYSDWPTIPQLYVKNQFVGGCDIIKEMYENGELAKLFESQNINFKKKS